MKGYCLVVKKKDEIYSVELIPDEANVADTYPVDVIKEYCRKYSVLPFPIDFWDDHAEEIEWFVIRDSERLEKIKWPDPRNEKEKRVIKAIQIQVYRVFEILQVDYKQALEALDNPVITRALGLGWRPQGLGSALDLLANAMEENNQAEAYRENIMDMSEDVPEAVEATESIYEYAADEFLEEEGKLKSGPKALKDMTDEELIEEVTQLFNSIYADDPTGKVREFFIDPTTDYAKCFGSDDVIRHKELEAQLAERDYVIHTISEYSVQKREEE